jgi:hypothetical protein
LLPTRNESDNISKNKDKGVCRSYLNYMANHRLVQLANSGDVYALRDLADNLIMGSEHSQQSFQMSQDIRNGSEKEGQGNIGDLNQRRQIDINMINSQRKMKAARLYTAAAGYGDVRSLMSLGWIFQAGGGEYIPKNLTTASSIFSTSIKWEWSALGFSSFMNLFNDPIER